MQDIAKFLRCILTATIGMMNKSSGTWSVSGGHVKCINNELLGDSAVHGPSNDHPGIQIDAHGQIQPPFLGRYVGDIGGPDLVGASHIEVLIQHVGGNGQIMFRIRCRPELSLGFCFDPELPHESRNTVATTAEALRAQIRMDSWCAIGSVAAMENIEDLGPKFLIFSASAACGTLQPSIVATTANIEQMAHAAYFESALVV